MIGLRLFLAQFRSVWRLRARLSDLRLDLFRRRFAFRSWAGAEAESSTAVLHIAKLTLLDLALASIVALVVWWLNPLVSSRRLVFSDAAYVQLLGTVAAIGGVFIGLYYAALTAAMTAVYAQMPNTVRQLLMQERYGNAYMRFVATVTFLSLTLLLGQTLGISTSALGAPVLTLAAGIAVFGFVKLGTRAFRLFDPTSVSHAVFRDAYLLFKQVTVGGYQWRNAAFQHFAQRRGAHVLRTLEELASICEASNHLRDEALVRLAIATLGFAEHSIDSRDRIPTDSAWFPQKYSQPEWYRTSDHETSIAHYTGTLLQPKSIRDHWWLEHRCEQVAIGALRSFLSRQQDSQARSVLSAFESYVAVLASHGWTTESLAIVDRLEDILVAAVLEFTDTGQLALVNRVALIDCIGRLRIMCLLCGADWADALDRKKLDQRLATADWTDPRTPYAFGLHGYSLDRAEWLAERLSFERLILAASVTPSWYCAELLTQQDAEAISRAVKGLFRDTYTRMRLVLNQVEAKPPLRLVRGLWHKWLNRRTRGKTLDWARYQQLLKRHPLLLPRICHAWASTGSPA